MQKLVKILERNVQWFALGLGVLFLLWNVWGFVINSPASVTVSGVTKPLTADNVEEEIYNNKVKKLELAISGGASNVTIPTTDVLAPYIAKLDEKDAKVPVSIAINMGGTRSMLIAGDTNKQGGVESFRIAALPSLPAASFVNESHDITTINVPSAGEAPANNGVQPVMAREDDRWVSLRFSIPMSGIKDAFAQSFKNADLSRLFVTRFLQVELLREEKLPNGQWSEPVVVKALPGSPLPAFPGDEVVPQGDARDKAFQYKDAAAKQQKEVLTPAFPTVAPDAPPWYEPGKSPEKNKAAGAAKPVAPKPIAPAAPRPPMFGGAQQPGGAAGGGAAEANQLTEGEFDVNAPTSPQKEVIAHDITAQDGKTYRYAIRYKLANPVWDSGENLADASLIRRLALVSPLSDWSKEITIPSYTRLFVTNVIGRTQRATFEMFEWKDGHNNVSKVDASPGDTIKDWTVVDVRPDSRDPVVLLLAASDGKIERHSKRGDLENPDYQKMKADVQQPAAAALAK